MSIVTEMEIRMSKSIKQCVKALDENKDVRNMLPDYVDKCMHMNNEDAGLKLMMHYYMYYEMITEGINPYIESAKDTTDAVNEIIYEIYESGITDEKRSGLSERLLKLRQIVMDKMQVLTAYVDCFVVYEYILNRIQYRFEEMKKLLDDTEFAQDVVKFIFGSKDNVAINDSIHEIIGQLPMRMTRSRYIDIIRNAISVYDGSDMSSLESFIYMFRTNAMLYKNGDMDKYFTEFVPVLDELSKLDYENITKEMYDIYAEKITNNAVKLNDISDLYMQLGQIINELYIITVSSKYVEKIEKNTPQQVVIRGINSLFMEKQSDVWNLSKEDLSDEEAKLYWLGEFFPQIEGIQEQLFEGMNTAGAILEETMDAQKDVIKELSLTDEFNYLKQMSQLGSNSIFAEINGAADDSKVTADDVLKISDELTVEIKEHLKKSSRMVRRAIMANTIDKLPVFFNSPQEVAEYVTMSLEQCDDEAEKYASKQLIMEMMF